MNLAHAAHAALRVVAVCSDRTIYRVYSDFVDAATKGAVAIIHGSIPPINPMDPKKSFVYIYNNIFFSYAVDVLVPGTDTGDRQSYAQAAADVRGVAAYAGVDLPELYTLATTLVTYRGRRLIAQSIIPGIFHGDRASAHVYGSMDHGKTVQCKDEFHALMKKAAEKLHIAEHKVTDQNGKAVGLAACVESKGLVGSDGRKYILDLLRVFPRDANFPDANLHHGMRTLPCSALSCPALPRPALPALPRPALRMASAASCDAILMCCSVLTDVLCRPCAAS